MYKFIKYILILTFLASFLSKAYYFTDFINFVSNITGLEFNSSHLLSAFILSIEFIITFGLIFNYKERIVLGLSGIILLLFILLFTLILDKNYDNCHCFGNFIPLSAKQTVYKNVLLLILIAIYYFKKIGLNYIPEFKEYVELVIILFIGTIVIFVSRKVDIHISAIQISQIRNLENYLFIDVRHSEYYEQSHIDGAINIPYYGNKIAEKLIQLHLPEIKKRDSIIVYCDNKICGLSQSFGRILKKKFPSKPIFYLYGGYEKWENFYLKQ